MSEVTKYLLSNGFAKCEHSDYDCVKRIHVLHYLFWSEKLKHFAIGVFNESGKKGPRGTAKSFNIIMIPKPIYTIKRAEQIIMSIA